MKSAARSPTMMAGAFRLPDGTRGTVNHLLDWAGGDLLLLLFGALTARGLQRLRRLSAQAPVRCVQVPGVGAPAQALEHVRDPNGQLQRACHVAGTAWALVRPDGYLAATGEAVNARLIAAIERALGLRGDKP